MRNNKLSKQAVEFILTRDLEELAYLTGTDVSRNFGANKTYLGQIFEADQHISIDKFILREKLHRAAFILEKGPEITVEELSAKLGFLRTEHFIEEFEKYFAIKPGNYQNLKRQSKNQS
ncbi:MAG: helix-turn-helix transcriptional regulator [Candidatus Aminicenantes bacterium]|nr:MAG: helix-turn-helix transcriptional regulator [Candidatus Aminicenantes bacterium]